MSWPVGVERMAARRVRVRSARKRRRWRLRSRVEKAGALDEGDRGSYGVGRVEGKELLTKGSSLSEESELVDIIIKFGWVVARRFAIVDGDIVLNLVPFTCRGSRLRTVQLLFRDKISHED